MLRLAVVRVLLAGILTGMPYPGELHDITLSTVPLSPKLCRSHIWSLAFLLIICSVCNTCLNVGHAWMQQTGGVSAFWSCFWQSSSVNYPWAGCGSTKSRLMTFSYGPLATCTLCRISSRPDFLCWGPALSYTKGCQFSIPSYLAMVAPEPTDSMLRPSTFEKIWRTAA